MRVTAAICILGTLMAGCFQEGGGQADAVLSFPNGVLRYSFMSESSLHPNFNGTMRIEGPVDSPGVFGSTREALRLQDKGSPIGDEVSHLDLARRVLDVARMEWEPGYFRILIDVQRSPAPLSLPQLLVLGAVDAAKHEHEFVQRIGGRDYNVSAVLKGEQMQLYADTDDAQVFANYTFAGGRHSMGTIKEIDIASTSAGSLLRYRYVVQEADLSLSDAATLPERSSAIRTPLERIATEDFIREYTVPMTFPLNAAWDTLVNDPASDADLSGGRLATAYYEEDESYLVGEGPARPSRQEWRLVVDGTGDGPVRAVVEQVMIGPVAQRRVVEYGPYDGQPPIASEPGLFSWSALLKMCSTHAGRDPVAVTGLAFGPPGIRSGLLGYYDHLLRLTYRPTDGPSAEIYCEFDSTAGTPLFVSGNIDEFGVQ